MDYFAKINNNNKNLQTISRNFTNSKLSLIKRNMILYNLSPTNRILSI